jgi:hypothetical protein
MGLNDIILSSNMLTGLYKNNLIGPEEKENLRPGPTPKEAKEEAAPEGYKFLGKNKKSICLITKCTDAVFVSEPDLNFISKLIGACKMNLEDVAILNQANTDIIISTLKKQLKPKSIILFGVDPTSIKLPIHFPAFKLQEYNGTTYLLAPTLEELNQETNEGKILKSKLWVCLKQLFGL